MIKDRSLTDRVVELLLSADSVEEFDDVVRMLVFDRGIPVIRGMVENRERICLGCSRVGGLF